MDGYGFPLPSARFSSTHDAGHGHTSEICKDLSNKSRNTFIDKSFSQFYESLSELWIIAIVHCLMCTSVFFSLHILP